MDFNVIDPPLHVEHSPCNDNSRCSSAALAALHETHAAVFLKGPV